MASCRENKNGRRKLTLLCAPNVGLLDNWLPVVARLRALGLGADISCVFPGRWILEQIRENPSLQLQAEGLFSGFGLVVSDRYFLESQDLATLLDGVDKWRSWRLLERIWRPGVRSRLRSVIADSGWALLSVLPFLLGKARVRRLERLSDSEALFFDIREVEKYYCAQVLEHFRGTPAFSISHGLGFGPTQRNATDKVNLAEPLRDFVDDNVRTLLLTPEQRQWYFHRYALRDSAMVTCGIPRHDPDWMRQLPAWAGDDLPPDFQQDFVFLISRPATALLSPDAKRRCLEQIARQVKALGPGRIVIKRHPKEKAEPCFEQALGRENYGKTWVYSQNHPLDLGTRCRYAISFYSGIVVDLIWLGKPSIEYLDLRGNPQYDNEAAHRDEAGNPVLEYRLQKLVLGVQSEDELRNAIERIKQEPDAVLRELELAYQRIFPTYRGGAADLIHRDLEQASSSRNHSTRRNP